MDERKQKRKLSNRESARRSRIKKQQHLEDLVSAVSRLKSDNAQILAQVDTLTEHFGQLESENAVLRAKATELTETLRSLNAVLRFVEEAEIRDPLLRPWQPPCPAMPITASADMFQR